jgi:hypothetical protein
VEAKLNKKDSLNAWPYAIVAGIILIIIACAYTIKIALDNPVELDSGFYLSKYQDVDYKINELLSKQKIFDAAYQVDFGIKKIVMKKPTTIPIAIIDKTSNQPVDLASIRLLVTRPDTNAYNIELSPTSIKDGYYLFGPITVELPGRWQLLAKIGIEDKEGFIKREIYATP